MVTKAVISLGEITPIPRFALSIPGCLGPLYFGTPLADSIGMEGNVEPFRELLAVDQRQALEFFYTGLQEVADPSSDRQELLYNASVLAHHAQVSTHASIDLPTPATLSDVFDTFVLGSAQVNDGLMLETAGAQCLLLAGFFEDQMRGRHQLAWYAQLGAGFYRRAADVERGPRKARLFAAISRHFDQWRYAHAQLGRSLRHSRYLLSSGGPLEL